MSSIKTPDFNAPAGFKEILHDFALEVLRYQPEDVIEFAADYFENLLGGRSLENVQKYQEILSLRQKTMEIKTGNEKKFEILEENNENNEKIVNKGQNENNKNNMIISESREKFESNLDTGDVNIERGLSENKAETQGKNQTPNLQPMQITEEKKEIAEILSNQLNTKQNADNENEKAIQNEVSKNNTKIEMVSEFHLVNPKNNDNEKSDLKDYSSFSTNEQSTFIKSIDKKPNQNLSTQSETLKDVEHDNKEKEIFLIEDNHNNENNKISNKKIMEEIKEKNNVLNEKNAGSLLINIINIIGENLHLPNEILIYLCLLNYSENKEIHTKVLQTDQTPTRYYQGKLNLVLPDDYSNIQLLIRLKEKKNNEIIDLALKQIDLKGVFENDDKWEINKYFDLEPVQSKNFPAPPQIYLQIRWLFQNKKNHNLMPIDINEVEKTLINPIIPEKIVSGILALNIIKAKNLQASKSFGKKYGKVYCEFYFSEIKKTKFKSQCIDNESNPSWNENQFLNLNDLKLNEKKANKILFDVWEEDFSGDEFLGGIEFDLLDLTHNEGKWINNWFSLKDEFNLENPIKGDVYLQLCYFKNGTNIQEIKIPSILE